MSRFTQSSLGPRRRGFSFSAFAPRRSLLAMLAPLAVLCVLAVPGGCASSPPEAASVDLSRQIIRLEERILELERSAGQALASHPLSPTTQAVARGTEDTAGGEPGARVLPDLLPMDGPTMDGPPMDGPPMDRPMDGPSPSGLVRGASVVRRP